MCDPIRVRRPRRISRPEEKLQNTWTRIMMELRELCEQPNVRLLAHRDASVILIGTLSGLGLASRQIELASRRQIASILVASRPHTVLVELCSERLQNISDPIELKQRVESDRWNSTFVSAVHDAISNPSTVMQQYENQVDSNDSDENGGSVGLNVDNVVKRISSMVANISFSMSSEPVLPRIVLADRPASVTMDRLEKNDMIRIIVNCARAAAQQTVAPFVRLRSTFAQSAEPLNGEDFLLSFLPFPLDALIVEEIRPALHRLWWNETLSAAEMTALRDKVMSLKWASSAGKFLLDLSALQQWIDDLDQMIPSLLSEIDFHIAEQLFAACNASPEGNIVAVVNAFRLPGISAHFERLKQQALEPQSQLSKAAAPSNAIQSAGTVRILDSVFSALNQWPWWVKPVLVTSMIFGGTYAIKTALHLILPRVVTNAIYPVLSLTSGSLIALRGAKLAEYASLSWTQPIDPYDKLLCRSDLNQDDDNDRSIAAINKRVSNRGRQIGGLLLTASAAWLGIHLVTARGKGAAISHSTAFTIAAGCWTLGALEFVRAGTIVEKKCERIVRNVQANLQL